MNDENRGPEDRRRKERQPEKAERRHRERAENDASYHEGLRSGDNSRGLARRDYVVDPEVGRAAKVDEASALAAGQFDKQVWQQEALETVYEAQQSLWASILRFSSGHNSAAETAFLSSLLTVTTISADDENTLSAIDEHIRSSEVNHRFSDLTRELRLLRSKIEEYRLVREIVDKEDD
ncbi:MAG TPA: hypothetical protein VFP38_15040 [Bradyrhizobium sp.]|nr:hypothetical protein [Bradyrhizobium sp.]